PLVIAVDEELELALTPPSGVVHTPAHVRANEMTAAAHTVENGVELLVPERIRAAELGVEVRGVLGYLGERVVDLVVEDSVGRAAVGQRDAAAPAKRHLPIAVEARPRV